MTLNEFRDVLLSEIACIRKRDKKYCNKARCAMYDDCTKCSMDHVIALLGMGDESGE